MCETHMTAVCDDFEKNQSVNPRTGRKIKLGGPAHVKLTRECGKTSTTPKAPKANASNCDKWKTDPEYNPETGRKISKTGTVFKKLQQRCANATSRPPRPLATPTPSASTPTPSASRPPKCLGAGIGQRSGTCWFNSALNGLALSDKTSRLLLEMARKLPRQAVIPAACPLRPTKKYVLQYVRDLYDGVNMTSWGNGNGGLNRSVEVMKTAFTPGRLPENTRSGRKGHSAADANKTLLKRCFGEDGYRYLQPSTTKKLIEQDVARNRPFLMIRPRIIVRNADDVPRIYGWNKLSEVPMTLGKHPKFGEHTLSHAVYILKREDDRGEHDMHAVVAYMCGGKKFVYDANQRNALEIDWSKSENEQKLVEYSSVGFRTKFTYVRSVDYALYVKT